MNKTLITITTTIKDTTIIIKVMMKIIKVMVTSNTQLMMKDTITINMKEITRGTPMMVEHSRVKTNTMINMIIRIMLMRIINMIQMLKATITIHLQAQVLEMGYHQMLTMLDLIF